MRVTDYELSHLILRFEQEKDMKVMHCVQNLAALRDLVELKRENARLTVRLSELEKRHEKLKSDTSSALRCSVPKQEFPEQIFTMNTTKAAEGKLFRSLIYCWHSLRPNEALPVLSTENTFLEEPQRIRRALYRFCEAKIVEAIQKLD